MNDPLTDLLNAGDGDHRAAFARWIDLVYTDLKAMAANRLRREINQPLRSLTESPTSIAHGALLRLMEQRQTWENRGQFFGVATLLIRYIVQDYRDRRNAVKRGLAAPRAGPDEAAAAPGRIETTSPEMLEALDALAAEFPREAEVVSLHVFAKNPLSQVAVMLDVSSKTAERDWSFARAWIRDFLSTGRP